MGITISSLFKCLFGRTEMRIVMVGLDAAGKTTILYKLRLGEVLSTIPTIGFNIETVEYRNITFTSWDVGGQCHEGDTSTISKTFLQDAPVTDISRNIALIFVVDSNDRERTSEARKELQRMLSLDELRDATLLVFANKQDLPNALSVPEITDKLGLYELKNRIWHIQATCVTSGDGLYEGLEWLSTNTKRGH